jgi:hypothetical protein
LLGIDVDRNTGSLGVRWAGQGRVFQLERAANLTGPYLPFSPIVPDSNFNDPLSSQPQFFYRVRQW